MVPAFVLPMASVTAGRTTSSGGKSHSRSVSPKLRGPSSGPSPPGYGYHHLGHQFSCVSSIYPGLLQGASRRPPSSSPSVGQSARSINGLRCTAAAADGVRPVNQSSGGVGAERVVIHYYRHDGEAHQFGLHVWEDVKSPTRWEMPLPAAAKSNKGWVEYDVALAPGAEKLSFIVHRGNEECTRVEDYDVTAVDAPSFEVWVVAGNGELFTNEPDLHLLPTGVVDLKRARAIWVARDIIAVPFGDNRIHATTEFELVASASAGLQLNEHGRVVNDGGDIRYLTLVNAGGDGHGGWSEPDARAAGEKYPHVVREGHTCLRLPPDLDAADVASLLKCQLVVTARRDGVLQDATSVQTHGAIDDLFGRYDGPLGAEIDEGHVTVRLWAPTAKSVHLRLFSEARGGVPEHVIPMTEDATSGVWTTEGDGDWVGKYYQYAVEVYHPWADGAPPSGCGNLVTSIVTDPYSRSLSANGVRTHIADLDAPELKPSGWDYLQKPPASYEPTDSAIYELHIRDFSALDETVPSDLRGKYGAFGATDSTPVKHLAGLAAAGLTHVHLLPSYDFGSVPERAEQQQTVDYDYLAACAPNSDEQQAAIALVADYDSYNWGYDPVHYGVPEGSYASDPDGSLRVLEYRQMVSDLAAIGLRTVCDVVYNHTLSAGPSDSQSVLDKVVPGYYHRRNMDGYYENSTCCNNTASENLMMERLIVDDLKHWAKTYKVDGFRFDLMGHLMMRTIERARDALAALTMEKDGVDGKGIYMYGEGWDYAEVEKNRVGVNACQLNLGGTGVGSFNDRLREGIMGGSPFGDPRIQGVLTGLYFAPNGLIDQGSQESQRHRVMEDTEKIIAAMAGNLRSYTFTNRFGNEVVGSDAAWEGSNVAYANEPCETVNYVSAHDNETLFDGITLKSAPDTPLSVRCRLNRVAVSIVALSQGVPFFHAGDEILRSKSLDRDSYNSGDWFNRLDYSGDTHNFGIGLPGKDKNGARYGYIKGLLADPSLKPGKNEIMLSTAHMREVLAIRRSSPLFRLSSAVEIQKRVTFYNTGPYQSPGVIVMGLSDDDADGVATIDPSFKRILVCVNVTGEAVTVDDPNMMRDLAGVEMELHPLQGSEAPDDAHLAMAKWVGGEATVPPYTVVVFVERR